MNSLYRPIARHKYLVGASSLAMVVNDNAAILTPHGAFEFIASKLAPTGIGGTKKPSEDGFLQKIWRLFQAGHLLDGAFELGIGAVGAGTFRRHRVDTGNGFGQDAVEAALVIGTFFPGSGITDFRCAQQA
ncbi:hypothetical protein QF017_004436 [Pseudomonas laurylsulfatiphila]